MRKLTYTITAENGSVISGITSFNEAKALTEKTRGRMDAVMQEIVTPYKYTGKRVRPKAKMPLEMPEEE